MIQTSSGVNLSLMIASFSPFLPNTQPCRALHSALPMTHHPQVRSQWSLNRTTTMTLNPYYCG